MKAKIFISTIFMFLIFSQNFLFASGNVSKCDTKYPIVLVHGFAAQSNVIGIADYFWGIKDSLNDEGGKVYITSVNAMDSIYNKAVSFKRQYLEILAIEHTTKGNIIGHSQGGLYSRYAMSNLDIGKNVASYTSLCSPHKGSSVADWVFKIVPQGSWNSLGNACDFVYTFVFGDKNPQSLTNGLELTRPYMNNVFNPNNPNVSGVYYQSYAGKINYVSNSIILQIPWLICKSFEGDNDGVVAVSSAQWGNFRGVISGAWWSGGVDHVNMVNHFFGITPGFDAPQFYVDVVADLKNRGY